MVWTRVSIPTKTRLIWADAVGHSHKPVPAYPGPFITPPTESQPLSGTNPVNLDSCRAIIDAKKQSKPKRISR